MSRLASLSARPRVLAAVVALTAAAALVVATVPSGGSSASAEQSPTTSAAAPATKQVYLRPVTTEGKPAPGWRVQRVSGPVDCSGTSPAAVNPGIAACFPTALSLRACWKSSHHTTLCVSDPETRTLSRVRYRGHFPHPQARKVPAPVSMTLGDGRRCLLRVGGAWSSPASHPHWVGFYSCTKKASVYASGRSRDGVNRSARAWSVRVWLNGSDPDGDHLPKRTVRTVYYVGTAAPR